MFYLVWILLNLALLIFFIRICITATKLLRENASKTASIIFVCGLFFIGCSNSNSSKQVKTWQLSKEYNSGQPSGFVTKTLEKSLTTDYNLYINYIQDSSQNNIPVVASANLSGFMYGINWKLADVYVERITNEKFQYQVYGVLEWKLLGAKIYTQDKSYNGIVYIDKEPA